MALAHTGAYFSLAPFIGAVLAIAVLGESFTAQFATAGALMALGVWLLLFTLPFFAAATDSHGLTLFSSFYCSGSLVFGGGHVILPLLQSVVVPPDW